MTKHESFIQSSLCVFVLAAITFSDAFILHKKHDKSNDIQNAKTARPKRDGDNLSDSLSASLSTGSVNMQSDGGINVEVVMDNDEDNECVPMSDVELNQYGLPVGEPLNTTEVAQMADITGQQYRQQQFHSYSNGQCPDSLLDTTGHHSINRNSLCPWTYVTDRDEDRYPLEMMFAQCHCPFCIDPSTEQYDQISGSTCKPIFHKVRVLRRCAGPCVDDVCRYRPDYELVPVACACVRPRTV